MSGYIILFLLPVACAIVFFFLGRRWKNMYTAQKKENSRLKKEGRELIEAINRLKDAAVRTNTIEENEEHEKNEVDTVDTSDLIHRANRLFYDELPDN